MRFALYITIQNIGPDNTSEMRRHVQIPTSYFLSLIIDKNRLKYVVVVVSNSLKSTP